MELLYETSFYLLSFPAKIMHKTFVNMVLTEVCSPSSPFYGTLLRIYSTGILLGAKDLLTF